jgi:transcriptional regulator PpsR
MKTSSDLTWEFGAVPMIEPEYLGGILATSSDIALLIDSKAQIHSILLNASEKLYGNLSHWEGRDLNQFLTIESRPKLKKALERMRDGETIFYGLELNHEDNAQWKFPVRYNIHCLGRHNKILLLGRDLRTLSENQQRLIQAQIAVERSIEEKREYGAHFRLLLNSINEPVAFVNADTGAILHANTAFTDLIGIDEGELATTTLQNTLTNRAERRDFIEKLTLAAYGHYHLDVNITAHDEPQDVRISSEIYRTAGQKILMCKLHETSGGPTADSDFINNLVSTFHHSSDAMVFSDSKGAIQYVNERFLDLVNAGHKKEVTGQNLSEFLGRGQIDLAIMLENVAKSGSVKTYATHLKSSFGSKINVETSVSKNQSEKNTLIAFIIREVSHLDENQSNGFAHSQEDETSAKDLVGRATLKEIVSETTDVIEKICIEAALEMTNNNRAAAAEMLGLSRQSLYVKLSKFDI